MWHSLLRALFLMALCGLVTGCASAHPAAVDEGVASFYADKFEGRTTANGETYDGSELTAAHRTLPFDTMVRVTRVDTGDQVTVRINDRGPFVGGRIIDLSRRAARELNMINDGVVDVEIEVLNGEADDHEAAPPDDNGNASSW